MRPRTGSGRPANRGHLRRRRSALPRVIERAEVRADAASRSRGAGRPATPVRDLLHRRGLAPRAGPGRRRPAGAGAAHRHRRPARHGPGPDGELRRLPPRPEHRPLVGPGRGPPPAPRARRHPRAGRPGGGRHRRHHRAPLGRQDRGARHLPRPGALQPRPLRQGQRPALAVPDGDGADALGRRLGSAVPHRARTFRALRPRPRAPPQEADRLGAPSPAADRALAAGPARGRGGGQQLLGHRPAAGDRPAPVHGHPPAPRRRSLRAGTGT